MDLGWSRNQSVRHFTQCEVNIMTDMQNKMVFDLTGFNAMHHTQQEDPRHPYLYHYTPWNVLAVYSNRQAGINEKIKELVFLFPSR